MIKEQKKDEFKKRIYQFELKLVAFIDSLPNETTIRIIRDQLLRSGTSVLANYIEAQYAYSKREFSSYFQICLRSTKESLMWFCLLKDSQKVTPETVAWFLTELDEYAKIFSSSLITLKRKDKKG
jgi:four helix bundle protein